MASKSEVGTSCILEPPTNLFFTDWSLNQEKFHNDALCRQALVLFALLSIWRLPETNQSHVGAPDHKMPFNPCIYIFPNKLKPYNYRTMYPNMISNMEPWELKFGAKELNPSDSRGQAKPNSGRGFPVDWTFRRIPYCHTSCGTCRLSCNSNWLEWLCRKWSRKRWRVSFWYT